jgi:hypothetical protein
VIKKDQNINTKKGLSARKLSRDKEIKFLYIIKKIKNYAYNLKNFVLLIDSDQILRKNVLFEKI